MLIELVSADAELTLKVNMRMLTNTFVILFIFIDLWNPKAKSGNSVGVMQITPILVAECNNILKKKKSKKRFTLSDRYSISKSKEMFLLMQYVYNPLNSIEQAIRAWNGGNHFSVKKTQRYFEKVMNLLKK